ncbi:hypothetical protein EVJ50_02415 [Synechococcus sp. RSCCF101]|uniref:hypothetical protein n=1 Tax=Synechococcus sp. RSCCF101 TaxID=2511069 RepID=UPI0012488C07|nr:hypothetical protein [Synechococcus sp. RSCCF101]QEY31268.1 hypothetical protein EVJ50_02415 [Synechococcus sp. RSCCF101]
MPNASTSTARGAINRLRSQRNALAGTLNSALRGLDDAERICPRDCRAELEHEKALVLEAYRTLLQPGLPSLSLQRRDRDHQALEQALAGG